MIYEKIAKSYPDACVLWIEENSNAELLSKYEKCKAEITDKRLLPMTELQAFHGTKVENINVIADNGFDVTKNITSAYGVGSYFARDAMYSKHYMHSTDSGISYMFVCDIIVGSCAKGIMNCKIDTDLFDCAVDNIENPRIYVLPYNYAAYPRYIVAFHKNAK
jgi:poly [ADP-ribose] polymerase 7/11/12/13